VHEPYGYGHKPGQLNLDSTSGRELWSLGQSEQ
jgi:hypothetical protein